MGGGSARGGPQPAQSYVAFAQRARGWYWRALRDPLTRAKFLACRQLLADNRRRHMVSAAEAGRARGRSKGRAGGREVSVPALRAFLALALTGGDSRKGGVGGGVRGGVGGGVGGPVVDLFESDDAPPRPRDSGRPPFLLFSHALDYLRHHASLEFVQMNR